MSDRMRPWRTLLVAVLLAGALRAPALAEAPQPAAALVKALGDADWPQVAACFHSRSGPLYDYLAKHFRAASAFKVRYAPFYQSDSRSGGLLTLEADGTHTSFPVEWHDWAGCWQLGEALPFDDQGTRVTRHVLSVDLTHPDGVLRASDTLELTPTGPDRRVFLRLSPALHVRAVTSGDRPLPFAQQGDVLYLERPDTAVPATVTVAYDGALPDDGWDFIRPEGTVLRDEYAWYPRALDGAFAIYTLRAKVPPGTTVVGVGTHDGVDRFSDAWVNAWTTGQAVDGETFYAGQYARLAVPAGGCTLEAYLPSERQALAPGLLAEASRILDFYGAHFGPYAYRKLALVETGFVGGYGADSAIALPHSAFTTPGGIDDLLAHEIAHNWTERLRYAGPLGEQGFMSEGVASYMDMCYHAERDGEPALRAALSAARKRYDALVRAGQDVPIARADDSDRRVWQTLTYDKAALVLHMLRVRLGATAFDAGLRRLFAQDGRRVDLKAFRAVFEQSSGKPLGWFFDQWLTRTGVPVFHVTGTHVRALGRGRYLVTGHLVQSDDPYVLDVPLVAVTAKTGTLYRVPVTGPDTPFSLLVDQRPYALMLDPLGDTLIASEPAVRLH